MKKYKIAEKLAEMLQNYANDVEKGGVEPNQVDHVDYIVDGICDMHEILYKDGIQEGHSYVLCMLNTDEHVKLFETVEVQRIMAGTTEKLKVMSILDVKPLAYNKIMIKFLGAKVSD